MAISREIDYISKDFDGIRQALIDYAKTHYANRLWSDFNTDNFGIVLLELVSYIGELTFYYFDRQANEAYIKTATQSANIRNLAEQLGYYPADPGVSTGKVTLNLLGPATIPVNTRTSTNDSPGVIFCTSKAASVSQSEFDGGATTIEVEIIQGDPKSDYFIAQGVQNEEVALTNRKVIPSSLVLMVGGVPYSKVHTFIDSTSTDKHFKFYLDASGRSIIRFGDGIFGRKLSTGEAITASYRIGGGTEGNVAAGKISVLIDSITNVNTIANNAATSGATDALSDAEIAERAPRNIRTIDRAVTSDDFADLLLSNIPAVAKVKATINPDTSSFFDVNCYVVPSGTEISKITTNPALLNSVKDLIDRRKILTMYIDVKNATPVKINFEVEAFISESYKKSIVEDSITVALENLLAFENTDFEQKFYLDDIYDLLDNLGGIERIEIKKLAIEPQARHREANASYTGNEDVESLLLTSATGASQLNLVDATDFNTGDNVIILADYNQYVYRNIVNKIGNTIYLNSGVPNTFTTERVAKAFKSDRPFFSPVTTYLECEESLWYIENTDPTHYTVEKRIVGMASQLTRSTLYDDDANWTLETGIVTSNGAGLLTDINKTWKTDQWQDQLVIDSEGAVFLIGSNNDTSLTLSTPSLDPSAVTTPSTGAYVIVRSFLGWELQFGSIATSVLYNTKNGYITALINLHQSGSTGDKYNLAKPQVATGEYSVKYTDDNGEVSFTIFAGNAASDTGDNYILPVTSIADDIIILDPNEIPIMGRMVIDIRGGLD